jgi:flagellar biosynthesis/type III secretory pathway protein FliH
MRRLTPDRLESDTRPMLIGERAAAGGGTVAVAQTREDAAEAQKAQLQAAFEDARKRGEAQGLREAEAMLAKRAQAVEATLREEHEVVVERLEDERARLVKMLGTLENALAAHAQASEELAVEVAYAAALRLLGERAGERSLMTDFCRTVVREYGHPPATLRVSDIDLSLIDAAALGVPVEADRRLAPGQCVIDTARGQFECGLDVRLSALTDALLATLAAHRSPA